MKPDAARVIASLPKAVRHTVEVMIDGALVPHILRHRDVPAFFRQLRRYHLLRAWVEDRHVAGVLNRIDLRDERSYQRTLSALWPIVQPALAYEVLEMLRLVSDPGGPPLTAQQLHAGLVSSGWKLSNQAANRVLRELEERGLIRMAAGRGYLPGAGPAGLRPEEARTGRLAGFLGGLTRTLLQRFEQVPGTTFLVRELYLLHEEIPSFLRTLEEKLSRLLDREAVPPLILTPEHLEDHVVVRVSAMGGPGERDTGFHGMGRPNDELFGCVVGGDVGNWIGSVDVAEGMIERHTIDRLLEEARAAGENGFVRARERHGIRSANTVRLWRSLDSLDDRAKGRARPLEVTAALLEDQLALSWPRPLTRDRLLAGLRERGGEVDPKGVSLALSWLVARGRIIPGQSEEGIPRYRLERPGMLTSLDELDKMRAALKEDLPPLSQIAEGVSRHLPGTGVLDLQRLLSRKNLEALRPALIRILDEVFEEFLPRHVDGTDPGAFAALGGSKVTIYLESHIKPLLL